MLLSLGEGHTVFMTSGILQGSAALIHGISARVRRGRRNGTETAIQPETAGCRKGEEFTGASVSTASSMTQSTRK